MNGIERWFAISRRVAVASKWWRRSNERLQMVGRTRWKRFSRADKQFSLFADNPAHPSIQLKPAGEFWSARVTDSYRALAIREENVFTWFWIGPTTNMSG